MDGRPVLAEFELRDDERGTWDMFFASVCSVAVHVHVRGQRVEPLDLYACAAFADEMVLIRRRRCPG